jgi:hypothetical protein
VLASTIRAKLTTKGEDIAGWIEKIGRYAAVADDRFGKAAEVAAVLIQQHLPGDFANPQWFHDSDKPVEQRLAEQFIFMYAKWKEDGEPPDAKIENHKASVKSESTNSAANDT